jgi:hypothetical protein
MLALLALALLTAGDDGIMCVGVPSNPRFTSVTATTVSAPNLNANFIDAGVVSVRGAAECDIGINGSETQQAICFNRSGGLGTTTSSAAYASYNTSTGLFSINSGSDITIACGSGNNINLNAGASGGVVVTGTKTRGSCTLNGASPSTCTATVNASAICGCFATGTTAAAGIALAANVATTTLTCTGPNGSTAVVNYHCF